MEEIWVTQLELTRYGGYISAHRTRAGAVAKLAEFAARVGLDASDWDDESGSANLDADFDVESYAVSRVPLED
jgi:hypothetical protein